MSEDPLVIWVNPEEFELCQTKPIYMDEHNELLNGMPRQIAALAARTDHCCLALMPVPPPAAQVQGEREGFEAWQRSGGFKRPDDPGEWEAWQARAALSAPPAADGSEPAEALAARLISERAAVLGHPVPWAQAIEITATITKMPDEEKAALLALDDAPPAAGVPEGWKLVPIRLTPAMILSGLEGHYGKRLVAEAGGPIGVAMTSNCIDYNGEQAMRRFWRGLLAAAPTPPASEQQQAVVMPELTEQEREDLDEFYEAVCCDAGHRVSKEGMRRLAEIGAVESVGFGKHRLTEFGTYLLGITPHLQPAAPSQGGHDSDCSTNNHSCPELLGPCDCSKRDS
ncbi:hypothetical protein [Pseudomonas sp. USHLN015]|uniref:hypothetical protein n=1 Tax=Pseudomonas sp. USHLN015 TaxID=3081296 RepID=UPI00301C478D